MTTPDSHVLAINEGMSIPIRVGNYILPPGQSIRIPLSFVPQVANLKGIRIDFSPLSNYLCTRTADGRPLFDLWAPLSEVDGYGRHAIAIHRGLVELGAEAQLRSSVFVDTQFLSVELMRQAELARRLPPAKVAVTMSVPWDEAHIRNSSVIKVAITQFETDHVPYKHIEAINRCDRLICTTSFQPPVWKKSGLTIPISVMTPGIDTDYYSYVERERTGKFRVLMLGALTPRKNTDEAVRMFQEASGGSPDWRLTIKSRGFLSESVRESARTDDRIEVIFGDAPPGYIRTLYQDHDCFLWPSKGEGVGLPPLEAMSTGMELVCANNSGMMDYLGNRWSYPIKTDRLVPADAPGENYAGHAQIYGKVGNYWVPSHRHGVSQLKKCFSNWRSGRGRGAEAAEYVRANHTLRHQAESILRVVEEYL